MTCINDSLSPDLLFNIFKRLDCIQITRIRRVCKQWFEIIDEHKSFWRILHLPEKGLKELDPSILDLFDRKSGSTLQDVDIKMGVEREHQEQVINTLKKSRQTLNHLFLKFGKLVGTGGRDLLESLSAVESLRVIGWYDPGKIRLRRSPNKRDSQEDGSNTASLLKVFWYYGTGRSILEIKSARFNNLVSLDSAAPLSSSEWREFLEGPSKSLKHLKLGFKGRDDEDHSGVPTLCFPRLEILELNSGRTFPRWILIPDTVKLIALAGVSDLPSISELWSWRLSGHRIDITNRLPKLRRVCLRHAYKLEHVVEILQERNGNVEAGLQADGVKMERIKTLILPYSLSSPDLSEQVKEGLERCRELVDVVEGDAESRFLEVEY